jgi:hypothetical protein
MRKPFLLLLFASAFSSFSYQFPPAVHVRASKTGSFRTTALRPSDKSDHLVALTRLEDSIRGLYDEIGLGSYGLSYKVFRLGMVGYYSLQTEGTLNDRNIFSIIDFAKPSTEKRFYTIDLSQRKVKFHTYVAHGKNTGENIATFFSNKQNSNQSSLGFYVTGETYTGSKGYSLRLDGKDLHFNDQIRDRAIVIHEADYVSESWIKRYGRLGRSQGCPALPKGISRKVIDTIKGSTVVFAYYPDYNYLQSSRYLKVGNLIDQLEQNNIIELVGTRKTPGTKAKSRT